MLPVCYHSHHEHEKWINMVVMRSGQTRIADGIPVRVREWFKVAMLVLGISKHTT